MNIVSREHVCMDTHVHEQASGRGREREFHHPVNSSRSELSYPPPTREREGVTLQPREESARRRESEEKKRASLVPSAGNFLWALGRGRQVHRSLHLFLIFSFGCSSAFLPWAEERFGGARAFGEAGWSTTWPNVRRQRGPPTARVSGGISGVLIRARALAHTHSRWHGNGPYKWRESLSRRFCCCYPPQVLSYCMAAVSGIIIGGCSCVCSCSEPHRVPLCVLKHGTQMQKAAMEGEPLTTIIHSHNSSGRDVDAVIMLWLF